MVWRVFREHIDRCRKTKNNVIQLVGLTVEKNGGMYRQMSICKRGKIYWLDITTPSGVRRSIGIKHRQKAKELHDKIKAELWDMAKLNKKPSRLFEDALLLFVEEAKHKKDFDTNRRHAIYWGAILSGWKLENITGEDIKNNLPTHKKALSPSTKNRYRTSILRVLSNVCSLALFTGARMTEILSLTRDKVDFERSIAINDVTKSGKARALQLNKTALNLLQNLKRARRNEFVFHRGTVALIGMISIKR